MANKVQEQNTGPELKENELNENVAGLDARVQKLAEQRDDEAISSKQLKEAQKPVLATGNAVIAYRLKLSKQRAKMRYKLARLKDRWAFADKMRAAKTQRKKELAARRAQAKRVNDVQLIRRCSSRKFTRRSEKPRTVPGRSAASAHRSDY